MADTTTKVVFDDPHQAGGAGAAGEAETLRVRTLTGIWRWALIVLTAVTIFLCINQQFGLRFFIGFTPLNTEYFYLLILCMLPFTFVIFPGSEKASITRDRLVRRRAVRRDGGRLHLPPDEHPQGRRARLGVRRSAAARSCGPAMVMWFVLMEALRRTGGWSLLLSVFPFTVYPMFAGASWLGPLKGTQSTFDQTIAYHMLSTESLLGIPIQAFADTVIGFLVFGTALMMTGAGKFFINLAFALCGTFRGGAAKVCIFASGLLGMMSGSIVSNVLTAGTMTIPTMKRTGFTPPMPARSRPAPRPAPCWRRRSWAPPPSSWRSSWARPTPRWRSAAIIPAVALLYRPVHAGRCLRRAPRSQGPGAPRTADACGNTLRDGWYYAFVVVVLIVMLLYFKRESHAPFYATALLLVLNQWEQPGKWRMANPINIACGRGRRHTSP